MEHFASLWWKEYLSYTTPPPPEKDFPPNVEQPKQVATPKNTLSRTELLLSNYLIKGPAKAITGDFLTSLLFCVF